MKIDIRRMNSLLVCPVCKSKLELDGPKLKCHQCHFDYIEKDGLINFIPLSYWNDEKNTTILKKAYSIFFNILGPIYESDIWYQWGLDHTGAKGNSITSIAKYIDDVHSSTEGNIIDIACGTATYSRRIVKNSRIIYGIDL